MATKPTLTIGDLVPKATARGLELPAGVAKALLTHASLDEARVMMCGLGIDGTGDSAWLCATDGHRLIRMPIAGKVPDGIGTVITKDEIDRAIARADAKDVIAHGETGAPLIVLPWCKESDWAFPPTGQVVPVGNERGEGETPWFNPAYMAQAFKIGETFCKLTKETLAISMGVTHTGGGLDPIRIDVNARNVCIAQVVVMPFRADACKLPATHRPKGPMHVSGPNGVEFVPSDDEAPVDPAVARAEGDPIEESAPMPEPKVKRTRAPRKAKADSETAHMRAEAA